MSTRIRIPDHGIRLSNGSVITHGWNASHKDPFNDFKVPVCELSHGTTDNRPAYRGQTGIIQFITSTRLPRHVHISNSPGSDGKRVMLHERIYVLGGTALVELGGELYVIPSGSLVTIAPGVPHTWTACPAGVTISKENNETTENEGKKVSEGTFTMIYEYEDITGFSPTAQTKRLENVDDYVRCDDLESIRIPELTAKEVKERCWFIQDGDIWRTEHA